MKITVKRLHKTKNSTIGELFIDGVFECYTLEDVERKVKIPSETAIPKGTYIVGITLSNRFKRLLPILIDVPNFEGVRIHSGNNNHDTDGCVLLGSTRGIDFIGNSKAAFNKFFPKLQEGLKKGKVFIEII